ncbi:6-bladed beta-propeller [Neolewinella agarilytica]|uniref:6-bladed beta-propeller n=1 Tax=Neolewinella agarilytica TaxID=478744 RepID=UPI0023557557|nr:6-bladed beta-propeller [Neolewinella agarilytica]
MSLKNWYSLCFVLFLVSCKDDSLMELPRVIVNPNPNYNIEEFPDNFSSKTIRLVASEALKVPGFVRNFEIIDSNLMLVHPHPGGIINLVKFDGTVSWSKQQNEHPFQSYSGIGKVVVDHVDESIFVYDFRETKRVKYDYAGSFIKSRPLPIVHGDVEHFDGAAFFNIEGYPNLAVGDLADQKIEILKMDDSIANSSVISYSYSYKEGEVPYYDNNDFVVDGNKLYFSRNYDDTLFVVTGNKLEPSIICGVFDQARIEELRASSSGNAYGALQNAYNQNIPVTSYVAPSSNFIYVGYVNNLTEYFAIVKDNKVLTNSNLYEIDGKYIFGRIDYRNGWLLNQMRGAEYDFLQKYMLENPTATYSQAKEALSTVYQSSDLEYVYTLIRKR